MNYRFFILSSILLIFLGIGCTNDQVEKPNEDDIHIQEDTIEDDSERAEIIVVSENRNIFLDVPYANSPTENKVRIRGLTTLDSLKVSVLDENGTLLNEGDQEVMMSEDNNGWNYFNQYIYFYGSKSQWGTLKIYSEENNYVQVPIRFIYRFRDDNPISVTYPEENMEQRNFIRLLGYASVFEGVVSYRVSTLDENIVDEGHIQATSGAPDTGLFAKDIYPDVDSQALVLEVFNISPKNGEEEDKISLNINFISE